MFIARILVGMKPLRHFEPIRGFELGSLVFGTFLKSQRNSIRN
jgi:hypothetical protein